MTVMSLIHHKMLSAEQAAMVLQGAMDLLALQTERKTLEETCARTLKERKPNYSFDQPACGSWPQAANPCGSVSSSATKTAHQITEASRVNTSCAGEGEAPPVSKTASIPKTNKTGGTPPSITVV